MKQRQLLLVSFGSPKRAQGLSMETLIIAAILIATIIIVVFVMARQGGTFTKGVSDCQANEGKCMASAAACFEQGGQIMSFACPNDKPACCRP